MSYNFVSDHHWPDAIVMCEDGRFEQATVGWLKHEFSLGLKDTMSWAGGAKAVIDCDLDNPEDIVAKSIAVSYNLHQVRRLFLVNHHDCGAYGGFGQFADRSSERAFHLDELAKAKQKVLAKFPDMVVKLVYVDLTQSGNELDFQVIE